MMRFFVLTPFLLIPAGCVDSHRYEVDMSSVKDFDWNGKIVLIDKDNGLLAGWKVDEVRLESTNGQALSIFPRQSELRTTFTPTFGKCESEHVKDQIQSKWGNVTISKISKTNTISVKSKTTTAPTTQPAS